ncbi:hypothetical protein [Lampropedia aestuarii]|uniref:hypothetical protein n=1 Tax=Lampropedia aestuarii TaxID=2562762 RepID=UPI002469AE34|nr:hypothetical protein [Lampropedia aestuarii]MDH5859238.1 hypothetical protein [Lampropedia aestuarii]
MKDSNLVPLKNESNPSGPCVARRRSDSGLVTSWTTLEELVAQTPAEAIPLPEWESMPMLKSEWPVCHPER